MNRSIAISILIFLAACAADRPLYVAEPAPPPGESVIYIYRSAAAAMEGITATIEFDGKKVSDLRNNSYTVVHVRAGDHKVSQYWKGMTYHENNHEVRNRTDLPIHPIAGHQYYYRVSVNGEVGPEGVAQFSQVSWNFSEVSKSTADAEIKKCKREVSK